MLKFFRRVLDFYGLWIFLDKLGSHGNMLPCGCLNFQVRSNVDYLDIGFPSKVNWRKGGFYM